MKTIAFYPYTQAADVIVELLQTSLEIDCMFLLVSNSIRRYCHDGWNNKHIQIVSTDEFDKEDHDYDVLWIVDSEEDLNFDIDITPRIHKSLDNQKKVIVTRKLNPAETQELRKIKHKNLKVKVETVDYQELLLYDVQSPVIVIAAMCPGLSTLDIGVHLMKAMKNMDYTVSLLGNNGALDLCGCRYIGDEYYNECMSIRKKVFRINNILHNIDTIDDPDAIIVVVSDDYHIRINADDDNFGENLYAVSKACDIDYLVVNSFHDYHRWCSDNSIDGYCDIASICLKDVDAIIVSNKKMLVEETEMARKPLWLSIEKNRDDNLFCDNQSLVVTSTDIAVIAEDIKNKLSIYSEASRW